MTSTLRFPAGLAAEPGTSFCGSGTSVLTLTWGIGGVVLPDLGGATTGNGGGAFGAAPGIGGGPDTGGGELAAGAAAGPGGGPPEAGAAGAAAKAETRPAGGATFGFSLNFPLSAGTAVSGVAAVLAGAAAGGGSGGCRFTAEAGEAGCSATVGTGAADAEVAGAGTLPGTSRVFKRMAGAPAEGVAATGGGADAAGNAAAGAVERSGKLVAAEAPGSAGAAGATASAAATGAASVMRRGLNRIFGASGATVATTGIAAGAGAAADSAGSVGGAAAGVSAAGADGAAAGVSASGGRRRGLRRSEGGGVCSSLMRATKATFRASAKPKRPVHRRKSGPKSFPRGQPPPAPRCPFASNDQTLAPGRHGGRADALHRLSVL